MATMHYFVCLLLLTLLSVDLAVQQPAPGGGGAALGSCMLEFLRLALPDERNATVLVQYELNMKNVTPPVDEMTVVPSDTASLFLALDRNSGRASALLHCLEGRTCHENRPCRHNGRCRFTNRASQGTRAKAFLCKCASRYTGSRCEQEITQSGVPRNISSVLAVIMRRLDSLEQSAARSAQSTARQLTQALDAIESRVNTRLGSLERDLPNRLQGTERRLQAQVRATGLRLEQKLLSTEERTNQSIAQHDARISLIESKLSRLQPDEPEAATPPGRIPTDTNNSQGDPRSCKDIKDAQPSARTGFHYVITPSQQRVRVYCEMERRGGGWTRVASIDPANEGDCPGALRLVDSALCGRRRANTGTCDMARFPAIAGGYREVMGFVTGYRFGSVDAFKGSSTASISGTYVDGVSVTYGILAVEGRSDDVSHLWTYAASFDSVDSALARSLCPCSSLPGTSAPGFVGSNYYCSDYGWNRQWWTYKPAHHLWSATSKCHEGSQCCAGGERPWFYRNLGQTTSQEIQIRLCASGLPSSEDLEIDRAAVFVR